MIRFSFKVIILGIVTLLVVYDDGAVARAISNQILSFFILLNVHINDGDQMKNKFNWVKLLKLFLLVIIIMIVYVCLYWYGRNW